jgi:hypothetical protein
MSKRDRTEHAEGEQNQPSLPLIADPVAGAFIGTILLVACLGGPVGLVLALIAWIVVEAIRREKRRGIATRRARGSVEHDDDQAEDRPGEP